MVLGYGTVYCTQSGGGGVHIFSKHKSNMYTFVQPRGCLYFPLKHKSAIRCHVYFCTTKGGGSRRDPNHKSMYKCAYMYVHLSLSPSPGLSFLRTSWLFQNLGRDGNFFGRNCYFLRAIWQFHNLERERVGHVLRTRWSPFNKFGKLKTLGVCIL